MKSLPLGTSDFYTLRKRDQIYVDKTDLIYELASLPQKFFLSRPRRFGKSLLISTFESLFSSGLKDFQGLKIEKLWKETNVYNVVRLDFSEIKQFSSAEEFKKRLESLLARRFRPCGFFYTPSDFFPVVDQLSDWLRTVNKNSLVLLIDEYDAPLTACLNDAKIFEKVRGALSDFYATLKSNDGAIRFMFMTGITKFNKVSIFSELNNFSDITLNPKFGTLLGYTPEETEHYFSDFLKKAEREQQTARASLMEQLVKNYDGFCFDRFAKHRVFSPWSVLKFLNEPELGFQNYWFESGGKPSVLLEYMKSHVLREPAFYSSQKSIPLDDLSGSSSIEGISDTGLLTQAGYLTIRRVEDDVAFLDYPNEEVRKSMALLYVRQILGDRLPAQVNANAIKQDLINGNPEAVYQQFNRFFASIDYQNYPVKDESSLRAIAYAYIAGMGFKLSMEVHHYKGRSDLEVETEKFRWIFEFKVLRKLESAKEKLELAVEQMTSKDYGAQYNCSLIKLAMVYSIEERKFVKWCQLNG